jgi:predicted PurR-regulated permease PerM
MENFINVKQPLYVKIGFILLSIALILMGLYLGAGLLVPLCFSFLFALLLHPLCLKLESLRLPRVLAIFICLLTIIVVLGVILYFITAQLLNFGEDLPGLQVKFNQLLNVIHEFIADTFGVAKTRQLNYIRTSASNMIQSSGAFFTSLLGYTTNTFADLSLMPVFIFFFLFYRRFFKQFLQKLFARTPNDNITEVMLKVQSVVKNYILGLLTVMVIIAALNTVGLLVLGIKYAFFFGALAALLNIIPYIGIFIGSVLPIIMALLTKDSIWYAVGVAGIFAVVQFLEGNFITPNIVGSKVSVNPLAAIIALIIGGMLWGPAGMILSIPFTAILKVIFDHVDSLEPFGFLLGEPPHASENNPSGDIVSDIKKEVKQVVLSNNGK